ncbi:S1C family serine protease [Arthrobacter roseus]|uniref:S1C family serine protease n=1 Tax=Arthrobacter roseus TaxID=136274 RepID=UPI001EF962F0|nr:trypsin-like peptidase domain-containing protein [Arthrobacter roseus]MBM7849534.1 S1-C subfamily serine protease [Arthrobacter roseus]
MPTRLQYAAIVAAGALLLGGCTAGAEEEPTGSLKAPSTAAAENGSSGDKASVTGGVFSTIPDIVAEVQPSVVTIFTDNGLGSGVVYTEDGLILTNAHVVGEARNVEVAFADGQRIPGTVRATDVITDLALVEVDRDNLPAATFEEKLPRVGELAVVIGSPLGFENTATAGIVSALAREIPGSAAKSQSLVDLIQTDAAISPGNSGGAVVNASGDVIGISEAYIPPAAGAVSLGFAIPAATAVHVAEQLREDGTAEHAFLGLQPATITPQIAGQLGIKQTEGVLVLSVVKGGPADTAGVKPGDVLTQIGDTKLRTAEDLLGELRGINPGDSTMATLVRDGEAMEVDITPSDRPVSQD